MPDLPRLVDESRAAGATVHVEDRTEPGTEVPPALGRTAYRVVQEALTNARKHAAGQPVTLVLAGTPGSRLTVAVRNPVADRSEGAEVWFQHGACRVFAVSARCVAQAP